MLTGLLDLRVTALHKVGFTVGVSGVLWRSIRGGVRGRACSGSIHLPQDVLLPQDALPYVLGVDWCWAWMELNSPGWRWW